MSQRPHDRYAPKDRLVYGRALSIALRRDCALSRSARCASAQYRSTQWTADSGLPQNSVRGIVHAADGYLWVATLDGIARFDGIRFTVFNKSNTPGITSNRFVAMAQGNGGDLWMASEDGNLIRYHAGHFEPMAEESGLRSTFGRCHYLRSSRRRLGGLRRQGVPLVADSPGASKGRHSTATTRFTFLCGGAGQDSGRSRTAISCVSRVGN